jgi:hypothetical protein
MVWDQAALPSVAWPALVSSIWRWMVNVAEVINLKGIVLAGLMQAQKLILASEDEAGINPQFRIMTPEGDFLIPMTPTDDPGARKRQLRQISAFLAWKKARVFTVAGQLINPETVFCLGATHVGQITAISKIERRPIRFRNPSWPAPEEFAGEILGLLPPSEGALNHQDLVDLHVYFGPEGRIPALRLGDGGKRSLASGSCTLYR